MTGVGVMINLKTQRLIIRDHVQADLEDHHRIMSDERVMYYIQDIKTHSLEESKANLQLAIDEVDNPKRTLYFLRIENKLGEHIGEIGYTVTDFTPVGKLVHLGYFIFPEFWGQGYVTEAFHEIMRFAFIEDNVFRITTACYKDNAGSEKVMQKCGMTKEGEFKQVQWHDGMMKDRVQYRMLKNEWMTMTNQN